MNFSPMEKKINLIKNHILIKELQKFVGTKGEVSIHFCEHRGSYGVPACAR